MSKITIVVSRYNEDLSWLNENPFNLFEYIVYNKGDNDNFSKTNVKKIINLPNLGRCDHTYLHHIVENYYNLSDIIVFFPGSVNIDNNNKKGRAKTILQNIIDSNYNNAYFMGKYHKSIKNDFYNFTINNYKCSYEQNFIKNNETKLFRSRIRPYGNWYNFFFGNTEAHWVTLGGVFSIDKRDIIQHPIERYINLRSVVALHSNPEVGHYIERSWGAIFYPLVYTLKISE